MWYTQYLLGRLNLSLSKVGRYSRLQEVPSPRAYSIKPELDQPTIRMDEYDTHAASMLLEKTALQKHSTLSVSQHQLTNYRIRRRRNLRNRMGQQISPTAPDFLPLLLLRSVSSRTTSVISLSPTNSRTLSRPDGNGSRK